MNERLTATDTRCMQPELAGRFLLRPRLDAILADALQRRVSIVSAPLGYGKSVALASYLKADACAAWYHAASWHAGGGYVTAIVEAVRTVRPGFGSATHALREQTDNGSMLAEQFLGDLRHSHEALTLVIEDAHELEHDIEFQNFLRILTLRLDTPVRLVIVSRTIPPLDITMLTIGERLSIISPDALRFTDDEIKALASARSVGSDSETLRSLIDRSGRWPAALSLMLDPAITNEHLSVSPDQLADDAISSFTTALREVLERAVIDPIWKSDAHVLVDSLIGNAIQTSLQNNPERRRALQLQAAVRAETAGRIRAALFHYEQAGSEHCIDFLTRRPDEIVGLGIGNELIRIIASLPREHPKRAGIAYLQALIFQQRGGTESLAFLAEAERLANQDDHALIFAIAAKRLELQFGRGVFVDPAEISALQILATGLGPEAEARAALCFGWSLVIRGSFHEAADAIVKIAAGDIKIARDIAVLQSYIHTVLGRHTFAQEMLDAILHRLETDDQLVLQARTLVWYARLALMWGDIAAAFDTANEAVRRSSLLRIETELAPLYAARSEAASHFGDSKIIAESALSAARYARGAWYAVDASRTPLQADLYTARGLFTRMQIAPAYMLACNVAARSDAHPAIALLAETEARCYALLLSREHPLLHERSPHVHIVDAVDALALATANELSAFLAALHNESVPASDFGEWANFIASAAPSASLALLGRSVRSYADASYAKAPNVVTEIASLCTLRCAAGPRFEVLIALAIAKAFVVDDTRKTQLLDRAVSPLGKLFAPGIPLFQAREEPPRQTSDLTQREHELLCLLVQGLTNKEMASYFVISPRTVETHVERILSKLDASTRARAIAKAIRLGLVAIEDIP